MNISVLLPLVFGKSFDYRAPEGMDIKPGDYVRVPFGRKSVWGVAWGEASGEVEEKKIKSIEQVATHLPPMSKTMRTFIDWVAWYTLAPSGMVLKMALPVPAALESPKVRGEGRGARGKKITASSSTLDPRPSTLSSDQQSAATSLRTKLDTGFSVSVLDGVTGSGKTEVYFDVIAACLAQGKQALVLLPEIALSVQWLARFAEGFGFAPDIWHSGVSPARKRETWRKAAQGEAKVIVGARSALFLPFAQLGTIIVDEEHDASYKQEDGVIYHARDMAVARARHEKIPAILVSATPSLETEYNITHGRYARMHLPTRHNEAELPEIKLIDMRTQALPTGSWISEPLKAALLTAMAEGKQAMLFMNRRGYAPLMLCRACGHRFLCPHCAAYLVLHRGRARLLCHHCGYETSPPKACPQCKEEGKMIPFGPGVERVAEEARALLPDARIAVMTSDSTALGKGTRRSKEPAKGSGDDPAGEVSCSETGGSVPLEKLIKDMMAGNIDLLIGTQMIAKGHHFAGLALVGVLDADMGLAGGDLRAGERTYQLLHQLAGRAGREKTKGMAWLQTYMPEHPVMQALLAGQRDAFMALEAQMREDALMPPYGKLAAVIVGGKNERETAEFTRMLVREAHKEETGGKRLENNNLHSLISNPLILGPAPAPMPLLRGKYRYRILIKAAKDFGLQDWLTRWLADLKIPSSIRVKIDVEPYSFL